MTSSSTPYRFFLHHAGYSYDPAKETRAQGRRRCAAALAKAERAASDAGISFEWDYDGMTSREWTDEGDEYPTWGCVARNDNGDILASLCGIDFADGDPWGNDYRRVVEAELAIDAGF